jgi:hypothetical protein
MVFRFFQLVSLFVSGGNSNAEGYCRVGLGDC